MLDKVSRGALKFISRIHQRVAFTGLKAECSTVRYEDWLNLKIHLLWCHNKPVITGRNDQGQTILRSTEYTNSGAWLVKQGWAQVEQGGKCYRVEPGQWLIVKPGQRVQMFSADARLISIAFHARWLDGSHLYDDGLSLVIDSSEAPLLEKRVIPILNAMKRVNPDTWDARDHMVNLPLFLNLDNLLRHWLVALAAVLESRGIRHSGCFSMDERVNKAIHLMQAADLGEPLNPCELAAKVCLSQNQLIRLFRRDIQTTPGKYWDRLRVEHARQRLLQPNVQVKEVSLELGFNHYSHFSKWFKQLTGTTPKSIKAT